MARRKPIRVTANARRDINEIVRTTKLNWGSAQVSKYRKRIDDALGKLVANPGIGHRANDIPDGYRLYNVGSHVIICRETVDNTLILRVLHQRMNRQDHL